MAAVLPHIERYVWQRDAFTLTSSLRSPPPWERPRPPGRRAAERQQQQEQHEQQQPPAPKRGPPCLWGAVAFGDSVDDEWFVAWLALELTRRFEGLAARVWDDDGEFLLIEVGAAACRWVSATCARRGCSRERSARGPNQQRLPVVSLTAAPCVLRGMGHPVVVLDPPLSITRHSHKYYPTLIYK
jgi:hypothetical protein